MSPAASLHPGWGSLSEDLAADVRRVADRLRTLSGARLAGRPEEPRPGWPAGLTRADAGRAAARRLARAAAALEAAAPVGAASGPAALGGAASGPAAAPAVTAYPDIPRLADFAVGDQVAVTGHDLLAALALVGPDTEVSPDGSVRMTAAHAVAEAAGFLAEVRRSL